MKQHITRADVYRMYDTVIFCDEIKNIAAICGLFPEYYNAGTFGWNWDLYAFDRVAVVGGYRSFPKYTRRVDYKDSKKIEKHLKTLKTQRGKVAAAIRLIKKYAGV